jgi:hypothetical protein
MAKISTYPIDTTPTLTDKLVGTEADNSDVTKNYLISDIIALGCEAGCVKLISPDRSVWTLTISDVGVITASK